MAEKKKMADILRFFTFYVTNLTLWKRYLKKCFHVSSSTLSCMLLISCSRTSSIMADTNFKMAEKPATLSSAFDQMIVVMKAVQF